VFRYATSLAARHGTLWVARWNRTWHVTPHDFDGRELAPGFVVRPEGTARVTIASIAVDEDRRVWIADTGSERVRAFTAFGRELEGLPRGASDRAGSLAGPIAIDSEGVEEDARIVVASIGVRRNALHVVRADGRASVSLRPRDADVGFSGLGRVAFGPRGLVLACEPASGLVLVWRDGQFHFAFRAPDGRVPVAVRALGDGRIVVASADEDGGALDLVDAAGRPIRALARGGTDPDDLGDPEDLAVLESIGPDRRTRIVVADSAGTRLAVWNLEGDSYGAFEPAADRAARES